MCSSPRDASWRTIPSRQREQEIDRSSRFDKYKSELKKFMFNPGQEIASVPLIGDKLALFEPGHGAALRPSHLERYPQRP